MIDSSRWRSAYPFLFIWTLLVLVGLSPKTLQAVCPAGQFCCPPRTDGCPNGIGCEECCSDANCPDDGNACNGTPFCGRCGGGTDDFSSPCCQPGTPPADNTVACTSDGTFCNGTELCAGGTCSGHTGNPCSETECNHCNENADNCFDSPGTPCADEGNGCTDDACNLGSCVHNPNTLPCNDLTNCTIGDVCAGGACNGSPVQCDDAIICTLDTCDEPSGLCQFDNSQCECRTDADCDDANVCTDEFCCTDRTCGADLFTCIRSNNTAPCDDGLFCNGTDICAGGTCSTHSGDPCVGGGECDQTCDENGDNCFSPAGVSCDDNNILTTTQCDGSGKCAIVATSGTQGGMLGCSLHSGGDGGFGVSLLSWVSIGGLWIWRLRNWKEGRNPNRGIPRS